MTREHFIDLIRVEQVSLRRFLLALCAGNGTEADDIAQESLIRAYVASGSFLGLSSFRTWLFRIAYNCFIDFRRRRKWESVSVEKQEVTSIPALETADASFRYQKLYQALDRLPEQERAAVALHYFEDRSIKEIAAILQMPSVTVKYHLFSARNHLKTIIGL